MLVSWGFHQQSLGISSWFLLKIMFCFPHGESICFFSVFPSANPALSLKHGDLLVDLLRVSSFHDSLYTNRLCFFASKKQQK